MDRSVSSIKAFLAKAVRQIYNRAERAFPYKGRQNLSDLQRFRYQVQGSLDSSDIGRSLVSVIARGMAANPVLLFLPHPEQDRLVVAASEAWGDSYPMSVQPSNPSARPR